MWDYALTVLGSIVIIAAGSIIATFVLRRFEYGKSFFSIRPTQRLWRSTLRRRSWMGGVLYVIGIIVIIFGCLLVIPTMSRVTQIGDLFLLLGTPMVINGMTLILYGVIIFALGKIIELLTQSPGRPPSLSAEGERKVLLTCPNCAQQMRIPSGNQGTIKCPKCTTRFEITS
jgi:hypothetical protein